MRWTDDPVMDAERYAEEQEEWLNTLPKCERCKEPIQQEEAVYYNDQWICKECEEEFWNDIREDFLARVVN